VSASQRLKGQRGERELFALLSDRLGVVVRRNIGQTRSGGADGLEIPGWAVECKRQQRAFLEAWWRQTLDQAVEVGRRPVLFYRANNRPWRAVMRLRDLADQYAGQPDHERVEMALDAACTVIRETLDDAKRERELRNMTNEDFDRVFKEMAERFLRDNDETI
jgi:hypothetical protein